MDRRAFFSALAALPAVAVAATRCVRDQPILWRNYTFRYSELPGSTIGFAYFPAPPDQPPLVLEPGDNVVVELMECFHAGDDDRLFGMASEGQNG